MREGEFLVILGPGQCGKPFAASWCMQAQLSDQQTAQRTAGQKAADQWQLDVQAVFLCVSAGKAHSPRQAAQCFVQGCVKGDRAEWGGHFVSRFHADLSCERRVMAGREQDGLVIGLRGQPRIGGRRKLSRIGVAGVRHKQQGRRG